jgi:hypothetical protein
MASSKQLEEKIEMEVPVSPQDIRELTLVAQGIRPLGNTLDCSQV